MVLVISEVDASNRIGSFLPYVEAAFFISDLITKASWTYLMPPTASLFFSYAFLEPPVARTVKA